jgi:hypothetical protein
MFARIKKSGKHEYLQIVENTRSDGKVRQRVIATVGRLDELQAKGKVETLIRSLARFSERDPARSLGQRRSERSGGQDRTGSDL